MYKAILNNIKWAGGEGPDSTTMDTKKQSKAEAIMEAENAYGMKILGTKISFVKDKWRNQMYDTSPKEMRKTENVIEHIEKYGIEPTS